MWVEHTSGVLRAPDRVVILGQFGLLAVREVRTLASSEQGLAKSSADPAMTLPAPTKAIDLAKAACTEFKPTFLLNHSLRTYIWARALGALDDRHEKDFDDELLYVICLLHDARLASQVTGRSPAGCFTFAGAELLRHIGKARRWSEERIQRGEEAVTLHMNPLVTLSQGVEAHLLKKKPC